MPGSGQLTVFREILRYVPQFRGRSFVIALDGQVIASDALTNLLRDVALLVSLNVRCVLLPDLTYAARRLAERLGKSTEIGNFDGPVDDELLELLILASGVVQNELLRGLESVDIACVVAPAIVAHAAGIRKGTDWGYAGKIDRVNTALIDRLLREEIVPVVPPLASDGEGHTYALAYQSAAAEVAVATRAVKLLYVTPFDGLVLDGSLVRQIAFPRLVQLLDSTEIPGAMRPFVEGAVRACQRGVERVHLINGLSEQGLLAEVFSAEGVGTLIHRDEYAAIRPATRKDASLIYRLLLPAMEREEVLPRSLDEVRQMLDQFLVYDIDGNVVGCVAVQFYPETKQAELACLAVDAAHENQGIGRRLVEKALERAKAYGAEEAFVLSTQTYNYFRHKLGFTEADANILPPARRQLLEQSARNSRVLRRLLK